MFDFAKKNTALFLAFLLPVLLIVIVALSVYLPSRMVSTQYNFLYATCADGDNYYRYSCNTYLGQRYDVVGGNIVVKDINPTLDANRNGTPDSKEVVTTRIFLHDTSKNESREITLEEAQSLKLSDLLTSPDGATVSSGSERNADFLFLFGGGSSYGHYLSKGGSKRKLDLINDDQYYHQKNFQFLGWVLPGRN